MKKIKIATLAVLALISTQNTFAQPSNKKQSGHEKKIEHSNDSKSNHIRNEIKDLTEEQSKKIEALKASYHEKIKTVQKDATYTDEEKAKSVRLLKAELKTQIDSVLTPEQRQQLHERQEVKGSPKQRPDKMHPKGKSMTQEMDEVVGLSDAQKTKINEINKNFVEKQKAVKTNTELSKEEIKKQTESLRNERKLEINKVLTKSQKKKWDAHQKSENAKKKNDPKEK